MPTKASLITVRNLPTVVENAVKAAHARLGSTGGSSPPIKKWEIYGKVARNMTEANSLAPAVAAEVAKQGVPVDPAVLVIDKLIWCGFIERVNIPVDRDF